MIAAVTIQKSLHPKLCSFSFFANFLHYCNTNVKSWSHDVDQAMEKVEAVIVKTQTRQI